MPKSNLPDSNNTKRLTKGLSNLIEISDLATERAIIVPLTNERGPGHGSAREREAESWKKKNA